MDKWNEIRDFLATELTAWGRDCCVSGSFLTRLPFPSVKGAGKKGSLGAASRAFPLVGAVIGVIAGLSLMAGASLNLHPLACALIALAVAALVTGALHEDGLADVADGFGGGATREEKLDIMRDSHLGTFAVITLVLVSVGPYLYAVRTMTMNVAQEDHVAVARAKGVPEATVLRRHILRVAAPPIVTGVILGLGGTLGGAILTETVFNWPGMGRLYYEAILAVDESVVVALTFMFTLIYVTARFTLDVLYIVVDPRVRYS